MKFVSGFSLFALVLGVFSVSVRADEYSSIFDEQPPVIGVNPGQVRLDTSTSSGYCPCVRWTVSLKGPGGTWENQKYLVSIDSLVNFLQTNAFVGPDLLGSRYVNIAPLETIIKGERIFLALGYPGVTIGTDHDAGYRDIIASGAYAMLGIFKNDVVRLNFRSGLDVQSLHVDAKPNYFSPPHITRPIIPQTLILQAEKGPVRAQVSAMFSLDFITGTNAQLASDVSVKLVSARDLVIRLGLRGLVEHDGFRNNFGLNPNLSTFGAFLDVQYRQVPLTKKRSSSTESNGIKFSF